MAGVWDRTGLKMGHQIMYYELKAKLNGLKNLPLALTGTANTCQTSHTDMLHLLEQNR